MTMRVPCDNENTRVSSELERGEERAKGAAHLRVVDDLEGLLNLVDIGRSENVSTTGKGEDDTVKSALSMCGPI